MKFYELLYDDTTIFTDGSGRPIERPARPDKDAKPEAWRDWRRSMHAFEDQIRDCANLTFQKRFK